MSYQVVVTMAGDEVYRATEAVVIGTPPVPDPPMVRYGQSPGVVVHECEGQTSEGTL